MKKIILYSIIFACLPFTVGWSYGIVDNTSTRDTLSIPFAPLDSLGNAVDLASGDSVYIVVFSPGGTVVFKDSMAYNDASIKSYDWEDYTGGKAYVYTERVSVLDGASSAKGVFTYMLEVHDKTGAALKTRYQGHFQIVTSTLESSLDSAAYAQKALRPTTIGRTLDVTTTGEAGVDFSNIAGSLDAAEIGTDAITAAKIATDAIGASEIAANAIGASEIATGAIDADAIATSAIDSTKIAAEAIGASELASNCMGANQLAANCIGSSEFANNAITASVIATNAIAADEIGSNAIDADAIADGAIDAGAIASNAITALKIADNAIGALEIAADAIGASELATTAVDEIADGTWNEDTTGHYNVGTYGYEATGGGAGSPWSTAQRDSVLNALIDSHIGDKCWIDGSYTPRGYLDASISSRSDLTTSDNIGINWGDIINMQSTAPNVSVKNISGSEAAADSLELMMTGSTFELKLKRFAIEGANGTNASFFVSNTSAVAGATGVFFDAVQGHGLSCRAQHADYSGIYGTGGSGIEAIGTYHDFDGDLFGTVNSVIIDISSNLIYADSIANRVLEDSSHYQGEGGSDDSASIARWVWNTPQDNHTLSGTFGKYLDTEISGVSSGSGLYSYDIVVIDSTNEQIIPGVNITVRNINQTALIAVGTTDNQGSIGFNLDADSFLVISFSPGYIFDSFDTLIVSGPGVDTILGYRFDPGDPPNPDLCRLYGHLYDVSGNPEVGATITAWLPSGVSRADDAIVSPFRVETNSDSTGYFYIDLIPSTDLSPDTAAYEITVTRSDGTILRERVLVPDQSNWLLTW